MHELSIALTISNLILDTAEKHNARNVTEVKLEVGELTLLNNEQLNFAVKTLLKGTKAENCKITIQPVKAKLKCGKCGYEWFPGKVLQSPGLAHLESLSCVQCDGTINLIMVCPKCRCGNADIMSGKECIINEIVLGA